MVDYMEGLMGGGRKSATMARTTYWFNFGPVIEYLLVVFKALGLVLLRDVDRAGASDMDVVGMHHVRNYREVHLFGRPNEAVDEFELLFGHWDEIDERVEWTSVRIWASQTPELYMFIHAHFRATSLRTGGSHDESMTVGN